MECRMHTSDATLETICYHGGKNDHGLLVYK